MGIWKKITGIEKIEKAREAEEERLRELEEVAQKAAEAYEQHQKDRAEETARQEAKRKAEEKKHKEEKKKREEEEEYARLSPKEKATKNGEPWVDVLETHVNKDNIRNGFFELDWNKLFVEKLIAEGYGLEADPEEEIVDRWFREIVFNMMQEDGMDTDRGAGYINVVPISENKSEVS